MGKKVELQVQSETGATAFLAVSVPGLTRAKADRLVKSGEVKVNGARVKTNVKLVPGDEVSVFLPDGFAVDINVPVVYTDDNIVIFDKPKRVPFDAIPKIVGDKLFPVHRLDTNTTGIIVFARTESAQSELVEAFRSRRIKKVYEAAVYPAPSKDRDTLTAYAMMSNGIAIVSDKQKPGYKTMITEYAVKKRIGGGAILTVMPHTGRTHQIRAHLAYIGCPIIGDPKYSKTKLTGAPDTQMLGAVAIEFSFPSGELNYLDGKRFEVENTFDLGFLD